MSKAIKRREFAIAGLAVGAIVVGLTFLLVSLNSTSFAVLSSNSEESLVVQVAAGEGSEDSPYIGSENPMEIRCADGQLLGLMYREDYLVEYARYNPAYSKQGFEELQAINRDVIGWISIFGTGIEYPLVQDRTNSNAFYLNHTTKRNFSLLGAIFLDVANCPDFTDFNSIIHGHFFHPYGSGAAMTSFKDSVFFDTRRYGNLFVNGRNYGLEFFAFIETHGYDWDVYWTAVEGREDRITYLENILEIAVHTRDIDITADDRIVLLSKTIPNEANNHYLLVAKLHDEPVPNEFPDWPSR